MDRERHAGLFEFLERVSSFILANLLWVAVSIPLVTLPAATAGLFNITSRWARGRPTEVFRDFFGGMRENWRSATLAGLLDALIGVVVTVNFIAFQQMDMSDPVAIVSRSVTFFFALMTIMVNLYFWPMLVSFDMPLRRLLENSVRLVFAHALWSFGMLIIALVPLVVSLFLPNAVWVLATFSAFALLVSKAAWRVIRRYVPPEELNGTETGEQGFDSEPL